MLISQPEFPFSWVIPRHFFYHGSVGLWQTAGSEGDGLEAEALYNHVAVLEGSGATFFYIPSQILNPK